VCGEEVGEWCAIKRRGGEGRGEGGAWGQCFTHKSLKREHYFSLLVWGGTGKYDFTVRGEYGV